MNQTTNAKERINNVMNRCPLGKPMEDPIPRPGDTG